MRKIFSSAVFWLLLALSLNILAYWRWFITADIYAWGDWGYHNPEFVRELFWFPQAWLREFMGVVDIGLPQYLSARLFYSALAQFLPFVGYDRITFLIPTVIAPVISVFLLVKETSKNNLAAFVGSIVYTFNTYILLLNTGHFTLSVAFAIGPFVFLLFKKAIEKKSFKYSIACGLVGFLCSGYEPRGFYLIAGVSVLYLLYSVFLDRDKLKSIIYGLIPLIIVVLANAFWILPLPLMFSSYQTIAINQQLIGDYINVLPRPFLLFSPWWTGTGKEIWGEIQTASLYFWLVPPLAFAGFWLKRHKPDVLFWAVISLLGIFLLKMKGEPFGDLYSWLYYHVPGFNVFRESSKFNYFIALGYAVLIGEFISWIWEEKTLARVAKIAIVFVVLSIFLYNGLPLVRGVVGHLQKPRHIPNDYLILKDFLKSKEGFFRVLYVPSYSKWVYRDTGRRMLGLKELVQRDQWRILNAYDKTGLEYSFFEETAGLFLKPFTNTLLDVSGVKYVVVVSEDKENDEAFIYTKETNPKQYIDFLNRIDYLAPIDIGIKELAVFGNEGAMPHFSFSQPVNYDVDCRDATMCVFTFKSSTSGPTELHFSEAYHPGWRIRLGEFSWRDSLWDKSYFLPEDSHKQTEFVTNKFLIPKLASGSQFTLYFAPQAYVNLGLIISLLTLSFSFGGLICLMLRR